MKFPYHDAYWKSAANFLAAHVGLNSGILAPNEFHEIYARTFPYDVLRHLNVRELDALVIHKGNLLEIGRDLCHLLLHEGVPLFGNEVFVIYSLKPRPPAEPCSNAHIDSFRSMVIDLGDFDTPADPLNSEFSPPVSTVILMTTFNRPDRLAHSLESISRLNAPILVVNDGSAPEHAAAYAEITKRFGVRLLDLPGNRGLSAALNIGIAYWLGDPGVEWICYLQDDVEVRADLLTALARVQHPVDYPLLTGRFNPLHKTYGERLINGCKVLLQRMSPGIHLHAHRDYWEKVLPIPTAYFQAPRKRPGAPARGADEDWWISQWSPNSVVKRGKYVAVLPDLVRTTTLLASESTWGNPGDAVDPPLPPPQFPTSLK